MGRIVVCYFLLVVARVGFCQPHASRHHIDSVRACLIRSAESQLFVREATNHNDHARISVYFLEGCGYKNTEKWGWKARSWCGAFVGWTYKQCGYNLAYMLNGNPAAVRSFNASKKYYLARGNIPLPGDVVTYTSWSHVEMVKSWNPNPKVKFFYAVGGNTTGGAKKHGVYTDIVRYKVQVYRQLSVF